MPRHPPAEMTISQFAKAADVGVETVRYYQRRGLLSVPPTPRDGARRYGTEALVRLHGIRRAQHADFTLGEISVLLRLDRLRDRRAAHGLAVRKIADIDRQIASLQDLRQSLSELTTACEHGRAELPCPIIEAFVGAESCERLGPGRLP